MLRVLSLLAGNLSLFLCPALATTAAAPAAPAPPAAAPVASHPRVLLIGIDGADLRIIDRLITGGRLPTFARLKREGASGPLRSEEPLLSPVVWTTIVTGRRPQDHRILDFVEIDPHGAAVPITSSRRRVPALWNIAAEFGKKSGFVGWYASFPAETVSGFQVSDRLGFHQVSSARAISGAAFPEGLARELEAKVGAPAADVAATRRRFVAGSGPLPADTGDRLNQLARIYATSEFYRKALPYLQERFAPDLLGVYFEGIDACGHLFMEDAPPRRTHVPPETFRAFSETVDRYYEYQDEVLADLLRLEGPGTVTMVVSDHGFKTGDLRPQTSGRADTGIAPLWHRIDGTVLLHGAGVRPAAHIERAGILDVAPTVVSILGVPLSRELPGRALADAFEKGAVPPSKVIAAYRALPERAPVSAPADPEALQKLRALGYLSGGGGAVPHDPQGRTVSSYVNEGQVLTHAGDWRGALRAYGRAAELDPKAVNALAPAAALYLQNGDPTRAAELLARASRIEPQNLWVLVQKASLALETGRLDDAERDLAAARRLDDRLPGVTLLAARLERARGHSGLALEELDRAEALADSEAMRGDILLLRSDVQASLGRFAEAEDALRRAEPLVPPRRIAAARGALAFARHDGAAAERAFRQALAADPESSSLERQLGEAIAAVGRSDEAEAAFRRAIAKARSPEEKESAWGDLSVLFQKTSRDPRALATLREAVRAVPDSSALWAMLGAALGRSGDLGAALSSYERSIALRPTALACKTLAALYFEVRKDRTRALKLWNESLALDPDQPEVREFVRRYGPPGPRSPGNPRPVQPNR